MEKVKGMIQVNVEDAKALTDTIVEVEACQELYETAVRDGNYTSQAYKGILEQYMTALKIHKAKWRNILEEYVEEETLLYYREAYLFDIFKKVIFLPENVGDEVCAQ